METRVCCDCGIEKPITEYYKRSKTTASRRLYCKVCHAARNLARDKAKRAEMSEMEEIIGRVLPWEAKLAARMIDRALAEAQVKVRWQRADALSWLRGYDVDIVDERGWSFGACIRILVDNGCSMPNYERIREVVDELARRAGVGFMPNPAFTPPTSPEDRSQALGEGRFANRTLDSTPREAPSEAGPVFESEAA
jgi:hypothetical protein